MRGQSEYVWIYTLLFTSIDFRFCLVIVQKKLHDLSHDAHCAKVLVAPSPLKPSKSSGMNCM